MKMVNCLCLIGLIATQAYAETDDEVYNQKVFELAAILYGASEIGAKSCSPAGTVMPTSLSNWWTAVNTYSDGETTRDKILNEKMSELETKMNEASTTATMQVDSLQLQIDAVDASIDSINGTYGRIPLREALLLAALSSQDSNGKENVNTMSAYDNLLSAGFDKAYSIAKSACAKTKNPVVGCDEAMTKISAIKSGSAVTYKESYTEVVGSTALNDKMESYEKIMSDLIAAVPKSKDSSYDWNTPMETALKKMKTARQDSGVKCPSSADKSAVIPKAAESFMAKIGVSDLSSVSSTFTQSWDSVDKVIGQAGNRGQYFEYVGAKINELLALDREKLQKLTEAKSKLETSLAEVKSAMTSTAVSVASGETTDTAAATVATTSTTTATSASTTAVTSETTSTENASTTTNAASLSTSAIKAASAVSSSAASKSASSSSSATSTSITGASLSLSGKSLAIANKSLASIADSEKKLASAAAATATTTNGKTSIGTASTTAAKATASTTKKADLKKSLDSSFSNLKKSDSASIIYKAAALAGLAKYNFNAAAAVASSVATQSKSAASSAEVAGKIQSSDSLAIAESIAARKSKNKTDYETAEDDSLFQIVTKAYIRNYEKVAETPGK
jgi:hypothetical protein